MIASEPHRTVTEEATASVKIRRSRFIARVAPCPDPAAAKAFVAAASAAHPKATHNCWAYVVGWEGETAHASDAGEPSGTAGRPMLNALRRERLTNVAAVVTRYYGGVKLGVRGLIEAYGQVVEEALRAAVLEDVVRRRRYRLRLPYDLASTVKHRLRGLGGRLEDEVYAAQVSFAVVVDEAEAEALAAYLAEMAAAAGLDFSEE